MAELGIVALEAALPAATVAAVAGTPNGLTANGQVTVGREADLAPAAVEAWWEPLGPQPAGSALGISLVDHPYRLTIAKASGTLVELRSWQSQVQAYFHGYRRPNVTGLVSVTVDSIALDTGGPDGPDTQVAFEVTFHGDGADG